MHIALISKLYLYEICKRIFSVLILHIHDSVQKITLRCFCANASSPFLIEHIELMALAQHLPLEFFFLVPSWALLVAWK